AVGVQMGHQWLEERLFPPKAPASVKRPQPNWAYIHTELKRKHVTLDLLWREYKQAHPDGLEYSSFCENYKKWAGKVDVSMRQHHAPADKLFVDYAGATIDVVDGNTGEVRHAQVFVAVLGASNYTFAEATWTQGIADWVGSHVRALNFFGGSPRCVVPDNLKSGVTRAVFFEPTLNETYADWARHYGIAI
ncbi:IS21 family transposase, partial [Klebsiella pneumoniae]